jgi:hypothetical protein
MTSHENMPFREHETPPTIEMLERALGGSFAAYEAFQDALPGLELEQDWQWYTPYKAWFAKGQHFWITPHGTRKEKNLYWLYVYDGHFSVAVWFKEKNRAEILDADVNGHTKTLIRDAETMGKVPTFPVVFDITSADQLADVYMLLDCKKRLEK